MSLVPISDLIQQPFKGIALFTPGGDLVYCIDPYKQNRWHLQLCAVLQEVLKLTEPPHFLVPCYTATVDCWVDAHRQRLAIYAEAGLPVLQYQAILNAVFQTGDLVWKAAPGLRELCDPVMLAGYRQQFPQLWQEHDLVMQVETIKPEGRSTRQSLSWSPPAMEESKGYVLRLFVSGNNASTESILQNLHELLEQSLPYPYTLKVVDIYKHPELAEENQVTATPTLVKIWPSPIRRIAGELNDANKILQMLSI
ncbi:MAG: circadian clock protein KaiB [Leptolyngbyaceae cyanobacterium SL_7_1]|nr:circadian clock protein KaiB [Leptolyngbyaceae cyanobacterium SL_7_1]